MAVIVKIMSGEDLADEDTQKSFRLFMDVTFVEFHRRAGGPVAFIYAKGEAEGAEYPLEGNVYVMNENGKTVSSFGCAPLTQGLGESVLPNAMR